ncbi:unnamed protein product, partial [Polarella glacialis]
HLGLLDPARKRSASFLAGCSAPDAYKFSTAPALHSLPFAGYLFQAARGQNGSQEQLDFALGWGCHLAQDMVGHHIRGFLNPDEDHWLELATDSYFWHSLPEVMLFEQISEEMQSWVVLASREAHAADPTESLPEISESDSNAAVSKFHLLTSA